MGGEREGGGERILRILVFLAGKTSRERKAEKRPVCTVGGGGAVAEAEPPTFSVQVGHSGVSVLGRYVGVPQQAIQNEQGHARDVAVVLQSYELSINRLERN